MDLKAILEEEEEIKRRAVELEKKKATARRHLNNVNLKALIQSAAEETDIPSGDAKKAYPLKPEPRASIDIKA